MHYRKLKKKNIPKNKLFAGFKDFASWIEMKRLEIFRNFGTVSPTLTSLRLSKELPYS